LGFSCPVGQTPIASLAGLWGGFVDDPPEMTKRRKILLLLASLGLALGAYMLLTREREPSYKGRKLSQWVEDLGQMNLEGTPSPEGQEAIRHIGATAVPYLLMWMDYDPTAWRAKLNTFCDKHCGVRWLAKAEYARCCPKPLATRSWPARFATPSNSC
jgi:hypothetical protein